VILIIIAITISSELKEGREWDWSQQVAAIVGRATTPELCSILSAAPKTLVKVEMTRRFPKLSCGQKVYIWIM